MINRLIHAIHNFLDRYVTKEPTKIFVESRWVICREMYYPLCDYSKFLCKVAKRKTLSENLIDELENRGYLVIIRDGDI